jgi:hypothetical protein
MKPIVTSSLAALAAGLILGGCAVAPVDGPYAYGYARPYYYDSGPAYYDTWPGYYPGYYYGSPYYGSPAIVGSFRFGGSDRDLRVRARPGEILGRWLARRVVARSR